jgi:membrane protein
MKTIWSYIRETLSEWNDDGASRLAAALSYYTVFSLAPLLVIAVAIAGLAFSRSTVQSQLNSQIQAMIGAQGANAIMGMLKNATQIRSGVLASILSIVILLFGASGVFGQLQTSMNIIWDVQPKQNQGIMATVRQRFLSFSLVVGVGFLLLVSLIASALLSGLNSYLSALLPAVGSYLWQVLGFVISFAIITLVFAVTFKVLPDRHIPWQHVWLGAIFTSLLFNIGKYLIGLYLGRASVTSAYGAAGSLVIILLWVYYSAQILFLGAEFTQVYLRRHRESVTDETAAEAGKSAADAQRRKQPAARALRPVRGWIPVTGEAPVRLGPPPAPAPAATHAPNTVLTAFGLMAATVSAWVFVLFRLVIPGAGPFRREPAARPARACGPSPVIRQLAGTADAKEKVRGESGPYA